jgi:hypothetical protein
MEINRNAPATAQGELQIAADRQTVFAVIAAIDQWPSWNPDIKSVTLQGPVQPGTGFRWKSGPSTLTSTLQVVDPPQEIAWTGTTMGTRPCTCSASKPTTAPPWRTLRSPGRACWPACSRAIAVSRWTRPSAASCRTSRSRPNGEPPRRERAAGRYAGCPVWLRAGPWQSGLAEIAAAGGAGRRHARRTAVPPPEGMARDNSPSMDALSRYLTATPCRQGPPPSRPIAGEVVGFRLAMGGLGAGGAVDLRRHGAV